MKYDYPGNIRELENIIERAVVLCRSDIITKTDLPKLVNKIAENKILDPTDFEDGYENKVKAFENDIILEALSRTNGNKSAAARLLNISERHLRSRMEIINIKYTKE